MVTTADCCGVVVACSILLCDVLLVVCVDVIGVPLAPATLTAPVTVLDVPSGVAVAPDTLPSVTVNVDVCPAATDVAVAPVCADALTDEMNGTLVTGVPDAVLTDDTGVADAMLSAVVDEAVAASTTEPAVVTVIGSTTAVETVEPVFVTIAFTSPRPAAVIPVPVTCVPGETAVAVALTAVPSGVTADAVCTDSLVELVVGDAVTDVAVADCGLTVAVSSNRPSWLAPS